MLEIDDLHIDIGGAEILGGVSLSCGRSEVVALVGESGCGKSMTALSVMGLLPPAARITAGRIMLDGEDITNVGEREMRALRGRRMGMVFQEPATSFNPLMTIADHLYEALVPHESVSRAEARARAVAALRDVGISVPERRLRQYPHQFSGGMLQRIMIAAAIIAGPSLLIADEPTTALDVTVQAQVIDLLLKIRAEHALSVLFITHDLALVAEIADRVAIMYCGRIVETAPVGEFFRRPRHPYSRGLLAALPRLDATGERLVSIEGVVPRPGMLPPGCPFAPRCGFRGEKCTEALPEMVRLGETLVACHLADELPDASRVETR